MAGKACPSGRCQEGSSLFGVVLPDGSLGRVEPPLPVTPGFVEAAGAGGRVLQRFRFTEACVEGGCAQWTGSRCGVVDRALVALPRVAAPAGCSLRPICRWFAQAGMEACRVCPLVVTEPVPG